MNAPELIARKRDGGELGPDEVQWFLEHYHQGVVGEEQMSALLMAVFFNGLSDSELGVWTDTMIASGERLALSGLSRPTVDKHSTGGVGDKISLILAPLVAACGAAVPQLSGRGLGHTGGTLDKLESIPGWRAHLSNEEVRDQLESVGAVICAAGSGLAPIDRRLYALRDVTSTVESIPLISSSIMSKKIAEGTEALVLDVKVGRGAFMKDHARALELARTMVRLGESHGVRTVAQLTDMNEPLGRAVGNAVEVRESLDVLAGAGPDDVRVLTLSLARHMLHLVGIDEDPAVRLDDGTALQVYRDMIRAQSGDPDAYLPLGVQHATVVASRAGIVESVDALSVGIAAWRLGAGRARKEDAVSAGAGVEVLIRRGDRVEVGQPLFEVYADDLDHRDLGIHSLEGALSLTDNPVIVRPLLLDVVGGAE
ncbi:MAG: thymidine phosphorylase [Acidimicrobiaceae bacterium]|nr:thymidine phosphorylase [Acidimicrobiaceae bacterium]